MAGASRKNKAPTTKKTVKKPPVKHHLKRGGIGIIFLIALVLILGLVVKQALKKTQRSKETDPVTIAAIPQTPKHPVAPPLRAVPPDFEIFPQTETALSPPVRKEAIYSPRPEKRPRIAIIIDDIGYDLQIADKFIDLNTAITLAILPYSPHQRQIVRKAREKGLELMLHLPMEPLEYPGVNPGPGALLTAMSPDTLIRQLNDDLDMVPFIKGANNHMGSRMTASSDQMNQIFSSIKKRDMFFIDSRTTADSRVRSSARLFQVPYAERDIFLDNIQEPEAIRRQFRLLLKKAAANGQALAIGHPHPITLQILREELPEIQKKVTIVPASSMVHPAG
jgi:polysaccharide deacetylase 2 family uncharacterized protein YibQ